MRGASAADTPPPNAQKSTSAAEAFLSCLVIKLTLTLSDPHHDQKKF